MEGAQCFIEVYKCRDKAFTAPDFSEDQIYVMPINKLKEYLEVTQVLKWQTIAVWYIKPKVKSL